MPRSVPCALLAALALAAPLRAEVTLTVKDLPGMVQSGTSLPFLVDVQGATPGQRLTVSASIGGKRVFSMEMAMAAPAEAVHLTIPVQALAVAEDLWIQAQCGPVHSAPRKLRAIPLVTPGSLGAGLEDKGAYMPVGKRWKSESSSSSSSRSLAPDRFSALPLDALETIVGFSGPSSLRYLSKGLNWVAEEATQELRIQGDLNDMDLMALVLKHPNVETITLGKNTPNLSPRGILAALRPCRKLRTLVNSSDSFTFPHVRELFETHEKLVGLRRPTKWERPERDAGYTDAEVALLPARMEELEFASVNLRDETIRAFTGLRTLHLTGCDSFRGDDLPESLTRLTIQGCSQFSGHRLPSGLVELRLQGSDAFSGLAHLPNLRKLSAYGHPWHQERSEALTALLRHAPLLAQVRLETPTPSQIAALPPELTDLHILEAGDDGVLADRDLARFTRLEHLAVSDSPTFTGRDMPASLRSLEVHYCPKLRSEVLGLLPLTHLVAENCEEFTCAGLPATLRVLKVKRCAEDPDVPLMFVLDHLKKLEHLIAPNWTPTDREVASMKDHPTLRTAIHGVKWPSL